MPETTNRTERNFNAEPGEAEIRAALGRLVSSPGLNKSPQLANFLTFVVGETLAGRGQRIKAYNVAADALGRDANFDPQNDPIVRVEAGRLRRALAHYYTNGGTNDPVVIELPRGHYVPVFKVNSARRRAFARVHELQLRLAAMLRENVKLVMMIVVITVVVTIAVDVMGMFLTRSVWPAVENAMNVSRPAGIPTGSTGAPQR